QDIQDLVVEPMNRVLVAALTEPPAILLYDLDQPNAEPERIDLPAAAEELTTAQGTVLAPLPNAEMLAKITLPEGDLTTIPVSGGPAGVAVREEQTLVALRDQKGIAVLEDGEII